MSPTGDRSSDVRRMAVRQAPGPAHTNPQDLSVPGRAAAQLRARPPGPATPVLARPPKGAESSSRRAP